MTMTKNNIKSTLAALLAALILLAPAWAVPPETFPAGWTPAKAIGAPPQADAVVPLDGWRGFKAKTVSARLKSLMRPQNPGEPEGAAETAPETPPAPVPVPWEDRPTVSLRDFHVPQDAAMGRLRCPSMGLDKNLIWSMDQWPIDRADAVELYSLAGLPGQKDYLSILHDHNYLSGKVFAAMPVGTILCLDLPYGTYTYALMSSETGNNVDGLPRSAICDKHIYDQYLSHPPLVEYTRFGNFEIFSPSFPDGLYRTAGHASEANDGDLVFSTCWPLDSDDSGPVRPRLLLRFKCIDGPLLLS